jgi:hypothetical protein
MEVDEDAGGRTPTAETATFGFESDFEATIFGSPNPVQQHADSVTDQMGKASLRDEETEASQTPSGSTTQERVPLPPPPKGL